MQVYIVGNYNGSYGAEGAIDIEGVFSTREAAEAAIEEYQAQRSSMGYGPHPGWEIHEFDLDPSTIRPWNF